MHFCAFLTVICQSILYHDAANDMLFRSGDIGVKVVKLSNFCTILQFSYYGFYSPKALVKVMNRKATDKQKRHYTWHQLPSSYMHIIYSRRRSF